MSKGTDKQFVEAVDKFRSEPLNYKEKYLMLTKQYARDIDKRDELLKLIHDDLKMRACDGFVDISSFIWGRLDSIVMEAE